MDPTVRDIQTLLLRDLDGMRKQIEAYEAAEAIWALAPGIGNSAGTLVLHCVGNLRHFIGAALGNTGFERDREKEFRDRDLSREALVDLLETAKQDVVVGLSALSASDLDAPTGLPGGKSCTRQRFLHHLCTHLAYHLGQVDYHRRVLGGGAVVEGIVTLAALDPGE